MPGKQPLHYYLCSRVLKLSQLKGALYKPNWQLIALLIFSFFLHIFANIKALQKKTGQISLHYFRQRFCQEWRHLINGQPGHLRFCDQHFGSGRHFLVCTFYLYHKLDQAKNV